MLPNRSGKDGSMDANDTGEGDRQGEYGHPFRMKSPWIALPIDFDANCEKWIKSSSECTARGEDTKMPFGILIRTAPPD